MLLNYAAGVIVLFLLYRFGFAKSGQARVIPYLILKNYDCNKAPIDKTDAILEMTGRRPGLIARIFAWLKIGQECNLTITGHEARVVINGFSGSSYFSAPLAELTTSDLRLEKPAWQFYLGVLILIGVVGSFVFGVQLNGIFIVVALIIAAFLLYSYWTSVRLVVAFSTSEIGNRYGLAFKPTATLLTFEQLLQDMQYINRTILDAHASNVY